MTKNIKWIALALFLMALFFSYTGAGLELLAQTRNQPPPEKASKKYIRTGSTRTTGSSHRVSSGGFRGGK